ncbi:MAG: TetR/AcrR family transcriptional regulator [Alphaproteobacteria bacterium]|uniref:TetR/AcrR family transcriptional regulator n=1 Tax=Agrobacterium sp. RAC06 TaxID=1842536 RepID=UPI00083D2740|nr:TetR/AcrR family transcriptional regulator [Agrobacterium sp. RAC06]AOG12154.1 bacterial regulatory s, tetR family protein [Agrobacterium sp. RAC06]MBU0740545.1 TetR/AcrR family transcriptional regulator [Alphaproteobacteria bacterium]MBU0831351.1 TetR/AcrR family transcriptional regulator [Alphaproteobacteria bacterium]MBU1765466.1 TetR/AcrR family transcriptional regulator [Alphaproteobacteria bacterium]
MMNDHAVEGRLQLRKKPQQERSIQRLEAILEAAVELFLEKGVVETTMSEIALRAGISIGSLYQFFPQKAAVIKALHERFSAQLEGFIRQIFAEVKTLDEAAERASESLIELHAMFREQRIYMALWQAIVVDKDLSQLSNEFHEQLIASFYRDLAHLVPQSEFERFRVNIKLMILATGEVIRFTTQQPDEVARVHLDQWRRIVRGSIFAF